MFECLVHLTYYVQYACTVLANMQNGYHINYID